MNLYPGADAGGPLAPPDWSMEVGSEVNGQTVCYTVDLHRAGIRVCRLALTGGARTGEEVHRLLATKARLWIYDYLSRPHTGTTEFGPLV